MNQLRLKEMIRLARFESGKGKTALEICKFYKSDYIAIEMIKTFFLTLIADVLILVLMVAGNLEWLLDHIDELNLAVVGSIVLMVLIAVMAIYLMITFVRANLRYNKAKRSVRAYEIRLRELEKSLYGKGV